MRVTDFDQVIRAAEAFKATSQAVQAEDDRHLRKELAWCVVGAIGLQMVAADTAFFVYGFENSWNIPAEAMSVWLGATVVQVIGMGLVITRSLFPAGGTK